MCVRASARLCVCVCMYAYVYFGHSLERLSCPFRWRPSYCCRCCCCFVLNVTKTGHHLDCFMIFTFPDKYSLYVCVRVYVYCGGNELQIFQDVRRTLNYLQRKRKTTHTAEEENVCKFPRSVPNEHEGRVCTRTASKRF